MSYEVPTNDKVKYEFDQDNPLITVAIYSYEDGPLIGYGKDKEAAFKDLLIQHMGWMALLAPLDGWYALGEKRS